MVQRRNQSNTINLIKLSDVRIGSLLTEPEFLYSIILFRQTQIAIVKRCLPTKHTQRTAAHLNGFYDRHSAYQYALHEFLIV